MPDPKFQTEIAEARALCGTLMTADNVRTCVGVEVRRPAGEVSYWQVVIRVGKRQVMNITQRVANHLGAESASAAVGVANRVMKDFIAGRDAADVSNLNAAWKRLTSKVGEDAD